MTDQCLPVNPRLRSGSLDNGLTYYVLHNAKPANRAELRLVVRVGSMNEREEERGLAHFVEHMGFKGTRSYQQYQLVRFLESLGIAYGPELNASTHLHETCYNLRVNVDEKLENLTTGLQIMEEWAQHMTISEEDVDSERSIIQAEWRSKQGPGQRMLNTYWKRVFEEQLYAERMPIGLPEVFMNCKAELLRDFYRRWYTPDRMSVVVVGDFADREDQVVDIVRELFSTLSRTPEEQAVPCPVATLPTHDKDVVVALSDPELTNASITFETMFRLDPAPTKDYVKQEMIRRMLTTLFDRRFHTLSKGDVLHARDLASHAVAVEGVEGQLVHEDPPFLSAGISIRPVVRNLMCLGVTVQFARGEQAMAQALNATCQELRRACEFGFTPSEVEGAKLRWMEYFEDLRDNASNIQSSAYTSEIVQHVLHDRRTVLAEPGAEASVAIELLQEITDADIAHWVSKLDFHLTDRASSVYTSGDVNAFRVISGQFPGDEYSDEQLVEAITTARKYATEAPLVPWPDSGPLATLLESNVLGSNLQPGEVVKRHQHPLINAVEYQLSNGIRIMCKWMPEASRGHVSMQSFALGGSSELTEEEEAMMSLLDDICTRSGVANMNGRSFSEIQSRYKTRVNTQRHHHHRGIGGSCPSKRFELLLQMLYLKFTAQNFDPVAFQRCIRQQKDAVEFRENAPEFAFMERARVLTVGDIPITRVVTPEIFDQLELSMAQSLYTRAFMRDPTEFTFVFTGDLPEPEVLEDLLQLYVGGLNPVEGAEHIEPWVHPAKQPFSRLDAQLPKETVCEFMDIVRTGDKSSVLMAFSVEFSIHDDELDVREHVIVQLCCSIVQTRLLDVLRIKFGHVYSVSCGLGRNSLSDFGLISISLHCDREKSREVCDLMVQELEKLRAEGPTVEEMQAAVEIMANSKTLAMENSSYWLFWLLDALKAVEYTKRAGGPLLPDETRFVQDRVAARSVGFQELLRSLTADAIREGFVRAFDVRKRVQLVLGPDPEALTA